MPAEVKFYNGTPTLFLDGKPAFDGLMWGAAPQPDNYALKECARYYGEAGIHIFTFDIGSQGVVTEWVGPQKDKDGHFDFSTIKERFQQVIDADPEAIFHLRRHDTSARER